MTNADHPPGGHPPRAEASLSDALESMARRGAEMAPPHERAYPAVRRRVRARRAAKATGAGVMSVAAVAVVATGALHEPPADLGYAPGVSGFTTAPSVPGFGELSVSVVTGHQPEAWKGTLLSCGVRVADLLGGDPSSSGGTGDGAGYGLEIVEARTDALAVRRTAETMSDDVMAGQVSYVWTQGDTVVSLPEEFMAEGLSHVDDAMQYDEPSAESTCMPGEEVPPVDASADPEGGRAEAGTGSATVTATPDLPAGVYEVRAYQYLVAAGTQPSTGTVDASITDPASWSAPVEVEVTRDRRVVPIH